MWLCKVKFVTPIGWDRLSQKWLEIHTQLWLLVTLKDKVIQIYLDVNILKSVRHNTGQTPCSSNIILLQIHVIPHLCLHLHCYSRFFPNLRLIVIHSLNLWESQYSCHQVSDKFEVSTAFQFWVNRRRRTDRQTECNTSSARYKCVLRPLISFQFVTIWQQDMWSTIGMSSK